MSLPVSYDMSTLPHRLRRVAAEVEKLNLALFASEVLSDEVKADVLARTQATARRLTQGPLPASDEA